MPQSGLTLLQSWFLFCCLTLAVDSLSSQEPESPPTANPALTLTVGDPLYPRDAPTAPRREQRTWLTTTLMQRIAALLPAAYRGVYSDWREGE